MAKYDVSQIAGVLSNLYTDRMRVYHEEGKTSDLGDYIRERVLLYDNVECRADPWLIDDAPATQQFEENKQTLPVLIFCAVNLKINKGDYIEVERLAKDEVIDKYSGYANAPQRYPSHQEIKIEVKDSYTRGNG